MSTKSVQRRIDLMTMLYRIVYSIRRHQKRFPSSAMISIQFGDVPSYLQNSDFFESLACEDPHEEFQVPAQCFATDELVQTAQKFITMLHVIAFWGLKQVPVEFFRFGCNLPTSELLSLLGAPGIEIKLAQDLHDIFTAKDGQYLTRAIATGRSEVVATILEHQLENLTEDTANTAAELGQLDILKLLVQRGCPLSKAAGAKSIAEQAAKGGHLECLKYLRELGCEWDKYLLVVAAKEGHVNILHYAHEQGLCWTPNDPYTKKTRPELHKLTPLVAAVREGHLVCVQYLLDSGATLEYNICGIACVHGYLEILKLLHAHGAELSDNTCFFALWHNHVSCLRYLVDHGCSLDPQASTDAARRGYLAMLTCVVEQGCVCTAETLLAAVNTKADSFACVQFLVEGKHVPLSPEESNMHEALFAAVLMGNAATVKFLSTQPGCALNRHIDKAQQICFQFDGLLSPLSVEELSALDDNIVGSLTAAAESGWDIRTYGARIISYIQNRIRIFPKANQYLVDNSFV